MIPVPGFIRIAAGERPAFKTLIGTTKVVTGVASLPVFVCPVEDKSTHADLVCSRADVGPDRLPLRG